MPLPTLMIKGKLRPPTDDMSMKRMLDEYVPIAYIMKWFRDRQTKSGPLNKVLILKSETASGKSTALPPEIFKQFVYQNNNARTIICTQPRIITAIENVNEMLKHYHMYMSLGKTIGWSTKSNKLKPTEPGLLSATIGTLQQLLKTNTDKEIIDKYEFILIDEVHERDLATDMSIMMLKEFVYRNENDPRCPFIVLMSATFDPSSLINFFKVSMETNFIWCVGETAGFDEIWDWNNNKDIEDYPAGAAQVVKKIVTEHEDDPTEKADILIFMPGKAEFTQTMKILIKLNEELANSGKPVLSLLEIDSPSVRTQNLDYVRTMYIPTNQHIVTINDKQYVPHRRVIITTNIAETGLTLDNLKYVIDAGFNKETEYNPLLNIRGLIVKPAPKSRIKQRRGRAGRKFRGVFYPLYTKEVFDAVQDLQYPQILVENISPISLDIIVEQFKAKIKNGQSNPHFSVNDISMLDCPSGYALYTMIDKLYSLGFISMNSVNWGQLKPTNETNIDLVCAGEYQTNNKCGLTPLGILAYGFSMISLESIRMIISAYYWDVCIFDIITIAAYMEIPPGDFVGGPRGATIKWDYIYKSGLPTYLDQNNIYQYMRKYMYDDFINGLILFNAIQHIFASTPPILCLSELRKWCEKCNLSFYTCIEFIKIRDDIIEQMLLNKCNIFYAQDHCLKTVESDQFSDVITRIKHCIHDGYRCNILTRAGDHYISNVGVKVIVENELAPAVLLYKELSIKFDKKTNIYITNVEQVSMMDGFVSIDQNFTI